MTKIKDLVAVTVSNAESFFLIDEERYELLDLFHLFPTPESVYDEVVVTDEKARQRLFLEEVQQTFHRAAKIYVQSQGPRALRGLEADLARRVEAALSDRLLSALCNQFVGNDSLHVPMIAACLWEELRSTLERSGFRRLIGYKPFSNDYVP